MEVMRDSINYVQISQLSPSETKVADVVGVSEGYVAKMASGRTPRVVSKLLTGCLTIEQQNPSRVWSVDLRKNR